jgi:hypothetical protein
MIPHTRSAGTSRHVPLLRHHTVAERMAEQAAMGGFWFRCTLRVPIRGAQHIQSLRLPASRPYCERRKHPGFGRDVGRRCGNHAQKRSCLHPALSEVFQRCEPRNPAPRKLIPPTPNSPCNAGPPYSKSCFFSHLSGGSIGAVIRKFASSLIVFARTAAP